MPPVPRVFALSLALLGTTAAIAAPDPAPDQGARQRTDGERERTDGERERTVEARFGAGRPDLAIRYRGAGRTLLQPGLAAALTVDLYHRDVFVENACIARGFRHRSRTVHLGGEFGVSARLFGDLLFVGQGQLGTRMTRTSGLLTGPSIGIGASRSVLMHPSWRVTNNGNARRGYLGGQTSIAATAAYELGWDLARRRETRIARGRQTREIIGPLVLHLRPSLTLFAPWNTDLVWMAAWDIGVRAPAPRRSQEAP